jgi:predicted dehydrogenase
MLGRLRPFALIAYMANEKQNVSIGIIGAGGNTRLMHLPGFQAIDGVTVDVICNRSEASSRKVATDFGVLRTEVDWRKVVADPNLDAIMIGTWPYLHAEATIAALEAGKHVLTEARMARNTGEAVRMLEASKARPDLVTQIVPAPMSLDFDAVVMDLLASGRLGKLREVCVTHTGGQFARADAPMSWRQDIELSGCNMLSLGIYYEIIRRWLGRDPVSIVATGAVYTSERTWSDSGETAAVRIPESVTCLGTYADRARLVGHFSGLESGSGRNEVRLNGSDASLRIDFSRGELFLAAAGSADEKPVPIPDETRRGWRVEADFVNSIRTSEAVRLTSFEDGIRYMKVTEAIFRSIEAGGAVQAI